MYFLMMCPYLFSHGAARTWEVEVLQLWRFSHNAAQAWEVEVLQHTFLCIGIYDVYKEDI